VTDASCTRCHAALATSVTKGVLALVTSAGTSIPSLAKHDEFPVVARGTDPGTLKMGHEKHLAVSLASMDSPERQAWIHEMGRDHMECADCHELDSSRRYMKPVRYAKHCAKCHPLEVSTGTGLPGVPVPHGLPPLVLLDHVKSPGFEAEVQKKLGEHLDAHPEELKPTGPARRPGPGQPAPKPKVLTRGLIRSGKRTASCIALDHVELIRIEKSDFDNLIKKFPKVLSALEKKVEERLGQQRKITERPGEMPLSLLAEKGVMNAQNLLVIDLDRCTRCDECVRACADQHDGLTRLIRDGLRIDKYLIATACRACTDPVCMIGCPVGSIRRRNSLEIIIEDWCIGCAKCAQQCPYGNITMHPFTKKQKVEQEVNGKKVVRRELAVVNSGKGKAVTCDLCGGGMEPRCVYACPHDAAKRGHPLDIFSSTQTMRG